MNDTTQKITFEQIKELMDKSYSLYYVDYRDDLSERLEDVQEAIHGDYSKLDEIFMDWDTWESIKEIRKQIRIALCNEYDLEKDEAKDIMDEFEDEIRDEIENRDDSTPLKDLLRNTGDQVLYFDTGLYIEEGCTRSDFLAQIRQIKRKLKIIGKDYDKILYKLCTNAFYGGRLVIFFTDDLEEWINLDEKINQITFDKGVNIALIHNGNGSGYNVEIGHSFTLPFNRENIFIDKVVKYSYTYDVCGMSSDWCSSTGVSLSVKAKYAKAKSSTINSYMDKEKKLNAVYKSGKCTMGDMNYSRHRNTTYINNYPCGNKCMDCGTFWID